jgi:hypothetical protein
MRGKHDRLESFLRYLRLNDRIPADHPLRAIRELVDAALAELSREFAKLYARDGRPSIPPERDQKPTQRTLCTSHKRGIPRLRFMMPPYVPRAPGRTGCGDPSSEIGTEYSYFKHFCGSLKLVAFAP